MTNLEKSELVVARILGLLMEFGLQNAELRFEELELDSEYEPFFETCIKWLIAEGIVRVDEIHYFMSEPIIVESPTLTAHGLGILGKKLSVGDSHISVGEAVQRASRETGNYSGVGDFVGSAIGGLLKSLGNG